MSHKYELKLRLKFILELCSVVDDARKVGGRSFQTEVLQFKFVLICVLCSHCPISFMLP